MSENQSWPLRLFSKSVLKQRKFKEITEFLGSSEGSRCLDIGSDNGVISYLLRRRGGAWTSADLDEEAVSSVRELVQSNVFQLDGGPTPFADDYFDRVVIVDFLEHINDDAGFVQDLYRVIRPGGELIINVPHRRETLLRKFRLAIGQTDEKHGHLRPGYTVEEIGSLLAGKFEIAASRTYSRFFSEAVDTFVTFGVYLLKGPSSRKGVLVTGKDMSQHRKAFRLYSAIYPLVWFFAQLDRLLFWSPGYMLILRTKTTKTEAKRKAQPASLTIPGQEASGQPQLSSESTL
jgi:SAM-dependent methyltransferase